MTSLQTTQAYNVTYDYGREGAMVDALLGGDPMPERHMTRNESRNEVAALPDGDDDGSFGESDDEAQEQQLQQIQQKVFSPERDVSPLKEPSIEPKLPIPEELRLKRQQVKNYQVMLEALAPVPGVNPHTIQAGIAGADVDVRDRKIIALARKARNYTVALASEREKTRKLHLAHEALTIDATALAKELRARGPLDPDAARYPFQEKQPEAPQELQRTSQREKRAEKRSADLRHKLETERAEGDKLRRALAREVGDSNLDDALKGDGEGRKGRAQQIVMLKNKVRRLEKEVSEAGPRKRPPRRDVDAVAQRELEGARKEREREVEEVFKERATLQHEVVKVKETLQASQARVVAQTQEVQRAKDHIRSLLEKTDGDDELVEALRREVAEMRDGLKERDAKIRTLEREKTTVRVARGGKTSTSNTHQDVARLERDNRRLQAQVDHQAKQLKKKKGPHKAPVYVGPEPVVATPPPQPVDVAPLTPPPEPVSFADMWQGLDADARVPGGSPPPRPLVDDDRRVAGGSPPPQPLVGDAVGLFSPSRTMPMPRQQMKPAPRGRRPAARNDEGAGLFSPSRLPPGRPDAEERPPAMGLDGFEREQTDDPRRAEEDLRAEKRRAAKLRAMMDTEATAQAQREAEARLWEADAARQPASPAGWTPPAAGGDSDGWSD